MTNLRIRVVISDERSVEAHTIGLPQLTSGKGKLRLDGLDGQFVAHFERWLGLRAVESYWTEHDIRSFGQLLFRCLFPREPENVWAWIEDLISKRQADVVRLTLQFPLGREFAYWSAIPWEYLHTSGSDGFFLARNRRFVLSRYIRPARAVETLPPKQCLRVLPVVSDPAEQSLGKVGADEVREVLERLDGISAFEVLPWLETPTATEFGQSVEETRPDVVHFIGHGQFQPDTTTGSLAMRDTAPGSRYEWVNQTRVADLMCPDDYTPRAVVLHSCDVGKTDMSFRFAGLPPELINRGVQCVVAMQYPIRDDIAQQFSKALYEQLATRSQLDEAVQACRDRLATEMGSDPRLIGLPVLYQRSADPLISL